MNIFLKACFTAALLAITTPILAQNAHETKARFMKIDQNAIVADYDLPANVVENALEERLLRAGLVKHGRGGDFEAYMGTVWAEMGPDKLDVYTKVEGKDGKATITMLVSKGYDNFISGTNDIEKTKKLRSFLNDFTKDVAAYQLRLSIEAQEAVVKKMLVVHTETLSDAEKLQRRKEKLDREIAENKIDQQAAQLHVDTEKKRLDDLKAKLIVQL